jgi:ArsR family transcriptional regulator, arsenate/arsenite/antimonite-responsive transcriptional repressor
MTCMRKTLPVVDMTAPVLCTPVAAAAVGLAESTIIHHLSRLRRAGLVESKRRGMNVYHRPRRESLMALCTVQDPNCFR